MRKIFIDCGAHDGCSVRKFRDTRKDANEFEIHSFECNPDLAKNFNEPEVNFYPVAVSDTNKKIIFYMHTNDTFAGTTYEKKGKIKNCGSNIVGNVTEHEVDCIKLSDFILKNFSKEDFIILKLDIEGEEYNVVPDLIDSRCMEMVDELWIEWHARWLNESSDRDRNLEEIIKSFDIKIDNTWDATKYNKARLRKKKTTTIATNDG